MSSKIHKARKKSNFKYTRPEVGDETEWDDVDICIKCGHGKDSCICEFDSKIHAKRDDEEI